jgi:hypothetical protein
MDTENTEVYSYLTGGTMCIIYANKKQSEKFT